METKYLSTTRIAKLNGLELSIAFKKLVETGLINHSNNIYKWELTEKGIIAGGRYNENYQFIEWPSDLKIENGKISPEVNTIQPPVSEGEEFIADFFTDAGIKYESQKRISNLNSDNKAYRIADFYLPEYKVYVEFLGHWNTSEDTKDEYRLKRMVYEFNNIPCVYLYPENLGILEHVFEKRLLKVLKDFKLAGEKRKYLNWKFKEAINDNILACWITVVILIVMYWINEEGKLFAYALLGYNLYKIYKIRKEVFIKESYSLRKLLYD